MTDPKKLEALRSRLLDEQRKLILAAADQDMMPAAGALTRIAELEQAIVAVDEVLENEEAMPALS